MCRASRQVSLETPSPRNVSSAWGARRYSREVSGRARQVVDPDELASSAYVIHVLKIMLKIMPVQVKEGTTTDMPADE